MEHSNRYAEQTHRSNTLSIRHGEILVDVSGLTHKQVWDSLIDFVLFGKPQEPYTSRYKLFFCWHAILKMQLGADAMTNEFTEWASPESTAADVLGWSLDAVSTALVDHNTGNRNGPSNLAYAVHRTIALFIEDHDKGAWNIEISAGHAATEPVSDDMGFYANTWCWYNPSNQPAYILRVRPGYSPRHRTTQLMATLIIQKDGMPWHQITGIGEMPTGHEHQGPAKWTSVWHEQVATLDELSKIRLDLNEIDY